MSNNDKKYEFKISAYTLDRLPMNRLAEYLADLSTLLGEYKSVHFKQLAKGSVRIIHTIEHEAEPKVLERIGRVRAGDGPSEAMTAAKNLDKRLALDNAYGVLKRTGGEEIIDFPGCKKASQEIIGPIAQEDTIEGTLIKIGGEKNRVPVHLQDGSGEIHIGLVTRELAKQLAPYLFGTPLRVTGTARWVRDRLGVWNRERFTVNAFTPITELTLVDAIDRLRKIDIEFNHGEEPLKQLEILRHG